MKVERQEGKTWKMLAAAHIECAEIALDISEACAVAARVSADRVGDAISAEYGLVETDDDNEEDSEDND